MTLALAQVIRGETGFTSYDAAFRDVLGARPTLRHVVDVDAHEGPVYVADEDALYFTTVPRRGQVLIKRLALGEWGLGRNRSRSLGPSGRHLCGKRHDARTRRVAGGVRAGE